MVVAIGRQHQPATDSIPVWSSFSSADDSLCWKAFLGDNWDQLSSETLADGATATRDSYRCRYRFSTFTAAMQACEGIHFCGAVTADGGMKCDGVLMRFELRSAEPVAGGGSLKSWRLFRWVGPLRPPGRSRWCANLPSWESISQPRVKPGSHANESRQVHDGSRRGRDHSLVDPAPRVAACITGRFRFFDQPCNGPMLVERLLLPTAADVFVFANVGSAAEIAPATTVARSVLAGTRVVTIEIISQEPSPQLSTCNDAQGSSTSSGFPSAMSVRRCAAPALAGKYDWVLRTRPDFHFPFSLALGLPHKFDFPTPNGVAIVKMVTRCHGCAHGTVCATDTMCNCLDDSFALLYGLAAQRAYLRDHADDFTLCRRANFSCTACADGNQARRSAPGVPSRARCPSIESMPIPSAAPAISPWHMAC